MWQPPKRRAARRPPRFRPCSAPAVRTAARVLSTAAANSSRFDFQLADSFFRFSSRSRLPDLLIHERARGLSGLGGPEEVLLRRFGLSISSISPFSIWKMQLCRCHFVRERAYSSFFRSGTADWRSGRSSASWPRLPVRGLSGGFDLLDSELKVFKLGLGGAALALSICRSGSMRANSPSSWRILRSRSCKSAAFQSSQACSQFQHRCRVSAAAGQVKVRNLPAEGCPQDGDSFSFRCASLSCHAILIELQPLRSGSGIPSQSRSEGTTARAPGCP